MKDGLASTVMPVSGLLPDVVASMRRLMQGYYALVDEPQFSADLAAKDWVILLNAPGGELVGFSTIACWQGSYEGRAMQVMFSGDTIIHHRYWGSPVFAASWLKLAARIKQQFPALPLYWLLIVKGHRTYRFLEVFARHYHPRWNEAGTEHLAALTQDLATARFGADYNAQTGVVRPTGVANRLRPDWSNVPAKDAERPEVKFFLARNPGYLAGDELVCVTEVAAANMRPFARRIFEKALQ